LSGIGCTRTPLVPALHAEMGTTAIPTLFESQERSPCWPFSATLHAKSSTTCVKAGIATSRRYSHRSMALRSRRGSSLILVEYPSQRQSGCGCCGCGCFLAPFLILLLFFLRCAEWFTKKLLTRI
jgi:hypothetical protein